MLHNQQLLANFTTMHSIQNTQEDHRLYTPSTLWKHHQTNYPSSSYPSAHHQSNHHWSSPSLRRRTNHPSSSFPSPCHRINQPSSLPSPCHPTNYPSSSCPSPRCRINQPSSSPSPYCRINEPLSLPSGHRQLIILQAHQVHFVDHITPQAPVSAKSSLDNCPNPIQSHYPSHP